ARMRRKTFPFHYAPEIFAGAALPVILASYTAHFLGWNVLLIAGLTLALLYIAETILARANRWYFSWRLPLFFLLRDLMLPVIYFDAWLVDDFTWRGNSMSVREEEGSSM